MDHEIGPLCFLYIVSSTQWSLCMTFLFCGFSLLRQCWNSEGLFSFVALFCGTTFGAAETQAHVTRTHTHTRTHARTLCIQSSRLRACLRQRPPAEFLVLIFENALNLQPVLQSTVKMPEQATPPKNLNTLLHTLRGSSSMLLLL